MSIRLFEVEGGDMDRDGLGLVQGADDQTVLAAVAGSTAVATYVASLDRYDENRYTPNAVSRTAVVAFNNDKDRGRLAQVEAELRRTLPVTGAMQIRSVYSTSSDAPSDPACQEQPWRRTSPMP